MGYDSNDKDWALENRAVMAALVRARIAQHLERP
jgi:hypothetical protein